MRARIRRRDLLLGATVGLAVILGATAVWRGVATSPDFPAPTSRAEGVVTTLVGRGDEIPFAAGALALEVPASEVWAVITDYPSFPRIFPELESLESTADGDRHHRLRGTAAFLGTTYEFEARVRHEGGDGRSRVTWSTPGGDLLRNRGLWEVRELDGGGTRLTYALDVAVEGAPEWAVRSLLRDRVARVLEAVEAELARRGKGGRG